MTYVTEMAERLDTMSSMKLGGFRSQLEVSCVYNHTEDLWQRNSLWMTIYTLPFRGLSTLVKELTATRVMQSSSNELSTPVYNGTKRKQSQVPRNGCAVKLLA